MIDNTASKHQGKATWETPTMEVFDAAKTARGGVFNADEDFDSFTS